MKKKTSARKNKALDPDMMESFNISPWNSVGKILPTSTKLNEDVFDSFRPNRQCVDYKISETWAKMQRGDVKVNLKQTSATYEEIPPEICKPQRKKKLKLFSGGPPQWKFIDEIWREHVGECQIILKKEQQKAIHQTRTKQETKHKNMHEIVQRLVGPDWFMELSPKQLQAVNRLRKSVLLDIRHCTVNNCQDVLTALGLVLRPNVKHIAKALQHSCGCPVEFLLVLYQILDPKRKSYSLNDRLLLSAVVHLTITDTLRELHIRIPSPPRVVKDVKNPKKKGKKSTKYKSPYLEPLTYTPAPPKFSGIYKNKHRQYPESSYFSYLPCFELEKRWYQGICFNYSNPAHKARMKEYTEAQDFYNSLPGAKQEMLHLIFPQQYHQCYNLLHPRKKPKKKDKLIPPHLCKVTVSEPEICFCEENKLKKNPKLKKIRRSCCEKNAQKFLQSLCLCDDCLEKVAQKNLIRVHGGFLKNPCTCDDPIPIIQGTLLNKTCECYKEYRNKIVSCAARQFLTDQRNKYVVGGITMTKFGPVYTIQTALGDKICNCYEIRQRKIKIKQIKETLWNNKAKFVIGCVTMTKMGPVFNLTAIVARRPCKCVVKYRERLKILEMQNLVRKNPNSFVNNGLINGKRGTVFYFSSVVYQTAPKNSMEQLEICSCEIKKPKCLDHCLDYLEYRVSSVNLTSSSDESKCISDDSSSDQSDSEEITGTEQSGGDQYTCPHCIRNVKPVKRTTKAQRHRLTTQKQTPCQCSSTSDSETSTEESDESETSTSQTGNSSSNRLEKSTAQSNGSDDFFTPKPCQCKNELERFMKAKCPCEECNQKIRQGYATYVMGGTKVTPSGQQVNVVQGIQQPLCSCMHDHLESIRKIDEYKSRVQARYHMKKQPKKYCISGVKNTPDGPVYIISGLRPPVDCECAKAHREKEEKEEFERQRAKMPNTGRIKYEISGVRAMPGENVYIMSRALNVQPCTCETVLQKFEEAHKSCMQEFENYLQQTEDETREFISPTANDELLGDDFRDFKQEENASGTFLNFNDLSSLNATTPNVPNTTGITDHSDQGEDTQQNEDTKMEEVSQEEEAPITSADTKCACAEESSSSEDENSTSAESSSDEEEENTSESSSESDSSECGSCHVEIPMEARPITLPSDKNLPESYLSKRFAIFRKFPCDKKQQMKIIRHILGGMAEDGFPLAKLPHVYKLPIFKLWLELRCGVFWTLEDKIKYYELSKTLWKHTTLCYVAPKPENMPFSKKAAKKMTWTHANLIKRVAGEKMNNFYRKLKQVNIETAREYFAPTFSYEFPFSTWRDCAFAYLPSKEEEIYPYKIVQPHDTRVVPENRKLHCYC